MPKSILLFFVLQEGAENCDREFVGGFRFDEEGDLFLLGWRDEGFWKTGAIFSDNLQQAGGGCIQHLGQVGIEEELLVPK